MPPQSPSSPAPRSPSPPSSAPPPPPPAGAPPVGILAGRYLLKDQLGRGGMATVYRALDTTLNRPVAVKLVHPHLCADSAFIQRFLDMEGRVARLIHPHLVTILDAGQHAEGHDGACFVVMEDVAGGTLRHRLESHRPLPLDDAVRLLSQIAGALQYLHDDGIVHGDVKPENVLLTERGDAKLIDFGIAQASTARTAGAVPDSLSEGEITVRLDSLHGTTAYLAPEQVEGHPATIRSDVYALGLVAYELLAGRRPFESDHWVAAATQRLVRDPQPLSSLRPDLPPGVAAAVARALSRDPTHRFPTVRDFARALADGVLHPPVPTLSQAPLHAPLRSPSPTLTDPGATTALLGPAPIPTLTASRLRAPLHRAAPTAYDAAGTRPTSFGYARGAPLHLRRWLTSARPAISRRLARLDRTSRIALAAGLAFSLLIFLIALPGLLNPPRPTRLPALAGQPLSTAQAAASAAGARLRVVETASDTIPRGSVVRQEPAADAEFRSDRPVTLFVSSGPPPVRVPDLRDRRLEDARKDLEALGLTLGKVQERETPRRPWGTVLGQSARGGTLLAPGTVVDVVVAAPPHTNAPVLAGRSLGDAEAELHKQGLVLGEVRQEAVSGKRAGTVLSQEPASGVRLRQGEAVAVTIAVPAKSG